MLDFIKMNENDKVVFEYNAICNKLSELNSKKYVAQYMVNVTKIDLENLNNSIDKFKFTQKIFNRKKYLEDKASINFDIENKNNTYKKYNDELNQLIKDINVLEERKKEISEISEKSIDNKFEEINRKIKVQITYDKNHIPIINDDQIENIANCIDSKFDESTFSFDDIALVHATNYFPVDGIIKSAQDSKVIINDKIDIEGNQQEGSSYSHRNSIHFALNGKVSSHSYGNWDSCKYIIIEPAKYHMDDINSISPEDTWTNGSIKLSSEAIILVEEKEYNKIDQNLMDKCKIIKYTGDSKVCVDKILLLLGYKPQEVGMHNWIKQNSHYQCENALTLYNFVKQNYPEKRAKKHCNTNEMDASNNLVIRDMVLSVLRNEIVNTKEGITISQNEFTILFKYYIKKYEDIFKNITLEEILAKFLKDYGVRYNNECFYLIDDKKIIQSYSKDLDNTIVEEFYNMFQPLMEEAKTMK